MDYLPNEILLHIIGYVRKKDVPKLRLVNTRFNLLATPFIPKLFQVDFRKDSDMVKFAEMFQNKSVVPFEKFGFRQSVSVEALKQFCLQFAKNVKFWQNFVGDPSKMELKRRGEDSISKNTLTLMEYCDNVEEINYLVVAEKKIAKVSEIPTLRNLKTITITYLWYENNKDVFPLLDKIFQNAPNLRNVSIENRGTTTLIANILHQLYKINGNVQIQKLDLALELPVKKMEDLQNLVAISTQFTILDLKLFMLLKSNSDRLPQTGEILSKWIENLASLRKLSLKHEDWRLLHCVWHEPEPDEDDPIPMAIPLRSHANLQCLTVDNLHTPILPHMQFPVLTTLDYMHRGDEFSFSGCVFPNVKFAKIDLRTEADCEQWPLVLPNVEELYVWSDTMKGIFRFPKVRKLHVHVNIAQHASRYKYEIHKELCWNNLTGDAEHISRKRICSFDLTTMEASDTDLIDSFRNLPHLTHLKFSDENIECWKAELFTQVELVN